MVTLYAARARAKEFVEYPGEFDAPPGLAYAGPSQERCWSCLYYKFQSYGSDDSNEGKCLAFKPVGKTHRTHALNWCPEYQFDATEPEVDFPEGAPPEAILYETLHKDGGKTIHSTQGVKVVNHEGVVVMKMGIWGDPPKHPIKGLNSLFGYETHYDPATKTYVVLHWSPKIAPLHIAYYLLDEAGAGYVADMVAQWSNSATALLQSLANGPESP